MEKMGMGEVNKQAKEQTNKQPAYPSHGFQIESTHEFSERYTHLPGVDKMPKSGSFCSP